MKIVFEELNKRAVVFDNQTIIGECDYIIQGDIWNIVHTIVDSKYQGQGIARKLVECVIDNAKKENKQVIADCSYAKKILEKKELK